MEISAARYAALAGDGGRRKTLRYGKIKLLHGMHHWKKKWSVGNSLLWPLCMSACVYDTIEEITLLVDNFNFLNLQR